MCNFSLPSFLGAPDPLLLAKSPTWWRDVGQVADPPLSIPVWHAGDSAESESRTLGTGRGLQVQEHGETAAPFVSGWNPNKGITAGLNPSEPQESRKPRAVRRGSDRRLLWRESQTVSSLINLLSDLGQVTASKFKFKFSTTKKS